MEEKKTNSSGKVAFITAIICIVLCIPLGILIGVQFIGKDPQVDGNKTPVVNNNTTDESDTNNETSTDEDAEVIAQEIDCGTDCIKYTDFVDDKTNVMHFANQTDSIQVYVKNETGNVENTSLKLVYNNKTLVEKTIMYTDEVQISKLGNYYVIKYNKAMYQCSNENALLIDSTGKVIDLLNDKVPKVTFANESISPSVTSSEFAISNFTIPFEGVNLVCLLPVVQSLVPLRFRVVYPIFL